MGCGCGGKRNTVRGSSAAVPRPAGQVNAQVQPVQRQALAQQARDRLQQNSTQRNIVGAREDVEKRRRIQVSLRNRGRKI